MFHPGNLQSSEQVVHHWYYAAARFKQVEMFGVSWNNATGKALLDLFLDILSKSNDISHDAQLFQSLRMLINRMQESGTLCFHDQVSHIHSAWKWENQNEFMHIWVHNNNQTSVLSSQGTTMGGAEGAGPSTKDEKPAGESLTTAIVPSQQSTNPRAMVSVIKEFRTTHS